MKNRANFFAGIICGILLSTITPVAMAAGFMAIPTSELGQTITVNGAEVDIRGYNVDDQNYFRLVDLAELIGFRVEWDGETRTVCIYTDVHTASKTDDQSPLSDTVTLPTDGSRYVPQVGDKVLCDDGTIYEITDVSRWNNNVFSPGPLPSLPSPTCDWSRFPTLDLPKLEVRHFSDTERNRETMWVRNLYETRRMQYTIYNALGKEPGAWKNGRLLDGVALTIPAEYEPITGTFWPWRASEVEKHVRNTPTAHFYVEAWDYYLNGVFQYTRYCIVTL